MGASRRTFRASLARETPAPLAATLVLGSVLTFAIVTHALSDRIGDDRGHEEVAAALAEEASSGRELVLFRPAEAIRGGMSFYLGRTIPEAQGEEQLLALRARLGERPLAVMSTGTKGQVESTLGPGEVSYQEEKPRYTIWILRYPAAISATAAPK